MEERLRKFAALVEAGGFTRAAQTLRVSQPALSVSIAKLERELRAPLLVHGVRPLTLTAAGEITYAAAKEVAVRTSNLQVRLAELAQRPTAVSLGLIDSVASVLLASPPTVSRLEQQATVSLVVDNSRSLLREVEAARLDVAFVVERPLAGGLIEELERTVEPLVLVGRPDGAAVVQQAMQTGRLAQFVSYDRASTTHQLVAEALQGRGIAVEPAFYSTSPEVILRLVLLGKGVAALPYLLVREVVARGELRAVTLGGSPVIIQRPIVAVKRRDVILSASLTRTLREVSDQVANLQGEARQVLGSSPKA